MKQTKLMVRLTCLTCLIALTGCATVQPWERAKLAKAQMQWESDKMQSAFDRHVYFSKEASSGGDSTAGGGCGCN
ncbi:MAG: hypothetical protein ACI9FJ_001472 [Alteromonadaceae bacterium]|jgi:hypothetical protein